jgi:hypothetical protein
VRFIETRLLANALPDMKILFVERSGILDKWLKFRCPCGCERVVALNLMKKYRPHWTLIERKPGIVSVSPSVHSTECGSHYWIRDNTVHWCD